MKKIICFCVTVILLIASISLVSSLANPAAKYCTNSGNAYTIKQSSDGSERGYCIVNGEEKDEWMFYRENKPLIKETKVSEKSLSSKNLQNSLKNKDNRNSLKRELDLILNERGAGAPSNLDWRSNNGNWVSPIKDQGGCGSCWAFSSVAVAESRAKIDLSNASYGIDLSEQDVVSCNSGGGDCDGGYEVDAMNHMKNTGIVKESCFGYTHTNNVCSNKCSNWQNERMFVTNFNSLPADPSSIKQAINDYGPVTVYMYADADFSSYSSGIYNHNSVTWTGGYHSVAIVGYNDTGSYWTCKNSWGSWGESGYFRINYSQNVLDFDAWYNDPYDNRTFFLDGSYVITETDITTAPTVNSSQANNTYAKSTTQINFSVYTKPNSIKQLSSVKINGTSMTGSLQYGGTFSVAKTPAQLGCSQSSEGTCTLIINATDDAGRQNTGNIIILIDDVAPRVTNISIDDADNYVNSAQTITATANINDANISSASINNKTLIKSDNFYTIITNASNLNCTSNSACNLTVIATDGLENKNDTEKKEIFVDDAKPKIQFVNITETSGSILLDRDYLQINVTANDTNLRNVTIYLYNSTGLVNSATSNSSPNFANFTGLADNTYFFNATATDLADNRNSTETRNITINYMPPVILSISPTNNSQLSAGTTSTTIILTTDESAICRYNTSDEDFANMTDMNSTNSTMHSLNVVGLENGQSYSYYFRCKNNYDNIANNSYYLIFSVNSPSTPSGGGGGGGTPTKVYEVTGATLSEGYNAALSKGDKIEFQSGSGSHTLTSNSIGTNFVNITIQSSPINIKLLVGESKKLNLSSNEYYDLYVKLESIKSGKANITLKSIYESIISVEESKLEINQTAITTIGEENKTVPSTPAAIAGWPVYVTAVIFLVLIIFLIRWLIRILKTKKFGYDLQVLN